MFILVLKTKSGASKVQFRQFVSTAAADGEFQKFLFRWITKPAQKDELFVHHHVAVACMIIVSFLIYYTAICQIQKGHWRNCMPSSSGVYQVK